MCPTSKRTALPGHFYAAGRACYTAHTLDAHFWKSKNHNWSSIMLFGSSVEKHLWRNDGSSSWHYCGISALCKGLEWERERRRLRRREIEYDVAMIVVDFLSLRPITSCTCQACAALRMRWCCPEILPGVGLCVFVRVLLRTTSWCTLLYYSCYILHLGHIKRVTLGFCNLGLFCQSFWVYVTKR